MIKRNVAFDKAISKVEHYFGDMVGEYAVQNHPNLSQPDAIEKLSSGAWEPTDNEVIDCMYSALDVAGIRNGSREIVKYWFEKEYGKKMPN